MTTTKLPLVGRLKFFWIWIWIEFELLAIDLHTACCLARRLQKIRGRKRGVGDREREREEGCGVGGEGGNTCLVGVCYSVARRPACGEQSWTALQPDFGLFVTPAPGPHTVHSLAKAPDCLYIKYISWPKPLTACTSSTLHGQSPWLLVHQVHSLVITSDGLYIKYNNNNNGNL